MENVDSLPPDITLRDVERSLSGCWFTTVRSEYVWKHVPGQEEAETGTLIARPLVRAGRLGTVKAIPIPDVRFWWPACGCVNTRNEEGGCALYVSRQPVRQWKKSLIAQLLTHEVVAGGRVERPPLLQEIDIVWALRHPDYPVSVAEVLDRFENSWPTVAINHRIALVASDSDDVLIYEEGLLAGKFAGGLSDGQIDLYTGGRKAKLMNRELLSFLGS